MYRDNNYVMAFPLTRSSMRQPLQYPNNQRGAIHRSTTTTARANGLNCRNRRIANIKDEEEEPCATYLFKTPLLNLAQQPRPNRRSGSRPLHREHVLNGRLIPNRIVHNSSSLPESRFLPRGSCPSATVMTPPCQSFKAKALPTHIQVGPDHRVRKTDTPGKRIDLLRDCELFGLLQYDCQVRDPELRESQIECWPVQRLFRRYVFVFVCGRCIVG